MHPAAIAGRLLAPYVGMSLYTWTAIIAVVLAGLSVGHWLGGVADPGDRRRSYGVLAACLLLTAITTALIPALVRLLSAWLLAGKLPPLVAISALTTLLFFMPSLFAGMVSPILTRLALDGNRGTGVSLRFFCALGSTLVVQPSEQAACDRFLLGLDGLPDAFAANRFPDCKLATTPTTTRLYAGGRAVCGGW